MDLECAIGIFMNGEFKQDWEIKRYHNIENPYIATMLMSCDKCGTQYIDQIPQYIDQRGIIFSWWPMSIIC